MFLIEYLKRHLLRWSVVTVSLVVTLSLAGYHLFSAQTDYGSFIRRLDYLFYDWRYNLALKYKQYPRSAANIVIVDIDERSLKTEGRWPWSRDKIALLVDRLAEAGAVVVGFDVLMTEPQINPTLDLQNRAIAAGRSDIAGQLQSFVEQTAFDQILADSFQATDIVLPFLFHSKTDIAVGVLPQPVATITQEVADKLLAVSADGYTANIPILQNAAIGAGFIVPSIDGDGVLRSAPIVQRYGTNIYPSLSLAIGMAYMLLEQIPLTTSNFGNGLEMISSIQFVDKQVMTDFKGRVLVPYLGPKGEFPYVSASDVLAQRIDPQRFENSIVLVGTSSVGLADLRSTPVGTQYPGVEVHANLLNGLLVGEFPIEPVDAHMATALFIVVLGILYTLLSTRLGPFMLTLATLGLLLTLVSINLYFWFAYNAALPMASSFLLTLALGTIHLLEGFLAERRAKQHVTSVFGKYVPSAHISRMLDKPDAYTFGGETRDMTVLFADIRSFTSISETLSATELKDLLNRYFTPITEVIFNHQGTVDKYVGDMVMAFWGAPLSDKNHALHALESAVTMLKVLNRLNPELVQLGYPRLKVGIGINTGSMNVGDMGSNFRRAYTVLGDAVNLGSRLENLTKYYDVDILVGPQTKMQCPTWVFRFVDKIRVKGKREPVEVYEPVAPLKKTSKRMLQELVTLYEAHQAYLNQEWPLARTIFKKLAMSSRRPYLYQVYIERIDILQTQTLPCDWDGTFIHENK